MSRSSDSDWCVYSGWKLCNCLCMPEAIRFQESRMPGNPLVRFDEGRVGRTARCRLLSYSTVIIVFEAVDNARDALFEERYVEVDQQPKTLVGEPEIGQKLLLV